MKQMQFLVSLLLTLIVSSTAYSQITGISREQKVEIVSTIESYDAVLIEIDLTEQLLSQAREMNILLRKQLSLSDELNLNLKAQIETFEKQTELQNKELKKVKLKGLATGGAGILAVVLMLILK